MGKKVIYESPLFSLALGQTTKRTYLFMNVISEFKDTSRLPHTHTFLTERYPEVLKTRCFNYKNLPFNDEVKNTEMGHLFEHLMLQELCSLKIAQGAQEAAHKGRTFWSQKNLTRFKISIDIGVDEQDVVQAATKTITALLEQLLTYRLNGQHSELTVK